MSRKAQGAYVELETGEQLQRDELQHGARASGVAAEVLQPSPLLLRFVPQLLLPLL